MEMHKSGHAFTGFHGTEREGLAVVDRRGMIKAGMAGIAGLTLPELLRARDKATKNGRAIGSNKSVILLWMCGGPSHIDTLDPKPLQPDNNRGPFDTIPTTHPGIRVCEHLPKYAKLTDKFTIIRSVDCRGSNHQPNQVMQTGNLAAGPRVNKEGKMYPAIGSIVRKFHGPNHPELPANVVLNLKDRTHFAWGGWLGKEFDPLVGDDAAKLFKISKGLSVDRLDNRKALSSKLESVRRHLDQDGDMSAFDQFGQQAFDLITGEKARKAFDLSLEPKKVIERYGDHPWAQKALMARRLVESGVAYVTIDLSNHSASGTWDTHGDKFPPYGGIVSGLKPLLPIFDHLFTTLLTDLDERGMLDDVLVIAMGEFGRNPQMGTQDSPDGRNHWPSVASMTIAGGGFRHGQVIGSTSSDGGEIKERPVTPGDLAATIYHHFGIPLDSTYEDHRGRPRFILEHGQPISEIV